MLSTLLSFLKGLGGTASSGLGIGVWLKIALAAILAGFLFYGYYEYSQTKIALQEATSASERWERDYKVAKATSDKNAEAAKTLVSKIEKLDADLLTWKAKYDVAAKKTRAVEAKIRKLEQSNAEVRSLLDTPVPCELWTQIWPESRLCAPAN